MTPEENVPGGAASFGSQLPRSRKTVGNSLGWMIVWAGLLAAPPAPEMARFEFSQVHMGMPFTLVLYAPDEMSANRAATAAFERIAQLDQVMSDYKADSELSKLTATAGEGKAVPLSDDLWRVLSASQKLSEQSSGAFDVTVGPYTKLWRRARREKEYPSDKRLNEARKAVGFQYLKLDTEAQTSLLQRPGMRIDLGGIAVGYALDEALKVLKANGISRALLDGSGDVLVGDPPPGKKGWRLGIAAPEENAPPLRFIEVANCAATTAGDTFQFVELEGRRFSHVIDPRTGLGLTTRLGVTVIARDAMTADSLDTALSVLGVEEGMRLLEQYEACEGLFVRVLEGGELEVRGTEGFGGYVVEGE